MLVNDFGKVMLLRLSHLENAPAPILAKDSGRVILLRLSQLENA
jgi:hypothetical protein